MRILLCDDHEAIRDGLRFRLNKAGFTDILEVTSLKELIAQLNKNQVDVLSLDLELQDSDGINTLLRVIEYWPRLKILVYTFTSYEEIGFEAIEAGALSYISKKEKLDIYIEAFLHVARGERYIIPALGKVLAEHTVQKDGKLKHESLSGIQLMVMKYYASGLSRMEISQKQVINYKKVCRTLQEILEIMEFEMYSEIGPYCNKHKLKD
jgi:DNA-binding NarL/FixJ family response regulator